MYAPSPGIDLPSSDSASSALLGARIKAADTGIGWTPHCPECGGGLIRVRRRQIDRWLSTIVPARRFRCSSMQCGYEGNVAKPAMRKRHARLTFAGILVATAAGVPMILGASYLTTPKPEVADESQSNVGRTGDPVAPAAVDAWALPTNYPSTKLSERWHEYSRGSTQPSDFALGFLSSSDGDRGAGMGRADANITQGLAGGGDRGAKSAFPAGLKTPTESPRLRMLSIPHAWATLPVDFTHSRDSRGDGLVPVVGHSVATAHPSEATYPNSVSLLDLRSLDESGSARQGGGPAGLDVTGSAPEKGGPTLAELGRRPTEGEGPTVFATATTNLAVFDATRAAPIQAAAPNAIPEPTTLALLGLGVVGLAASRWRRQ